VLELPDGGSLADNYCMCLCSPMVIPFASILSHWHGLLTAIDVSLHTINPHGHTAWQIPLCLSSWCFLPHEFFSGIACWSDELDLKDQQLWAGREQSKTGWWFRFQTCFLCTIIYGKNHPIDELKRTQIFKMVKTCKNHQPEDYLVVIILNTHTA
jgi:hypothetical protein